MGDKRQDAPQEEQDQQEQETAADRDDAKVEEASEESYPASDPPAW